MKEIESLISKSEAELEKNSQGTNIVGNRPHFPMLILFNDAFNEHSLHYIFSKLERIWPQSSHHLVKYRYSVKNNGLFYLNCERDTEESDEAFLLAIDKEQQEHDTFASMTQLMIYNVIDTSVFNDCKSFIAYYEAIKQIKEITNSQSKTMLIVLMNDSLSKRKTASEIKQFLSTHKEYDSTILISTRTRNNEIYEISDLYRLVSDMFVISNNDAVTNLDDEDYRSRFALLYNKTTYTLSYVLCEKPNHKIAIQINDLILDAAKKQVNQSVKNEVATWHKRFGFESGRSNICEKFISSLNIKIDPQLLEHIPLREIPTDNILTRKYKDFCKFSYEDIIANFAEMYCKNILIEDIDISSCCDEFKRIVCQNSTPAELIELDDNTLDIVFRSLEMGVHNDELSLLDYFKRQVEIHIRKDLIFPQFRLIVEELRNNANNVIEQVSRLQEQYKKYIPLNNDNIGTIYKTQTENYLNSQKGNEALRKVYNPQNNFEDIIDGIFACFVDVIAENKDLFSLPFIEEWECRLDMTGDRIYREISSTLLDKSDDLIRLYGNLPIDKRLKIFMLHTTDSNGNNPTKLYEHLKITFKDDELVQYFNTGYDDALESLTLISCNGNNLLL